MDEVEPERVPYSDNIISKRKKAEKAVDFFNRARTSLNSIWNLLEENKDEHEDIPALLESYKFIRDEHPDDVKKFPLIVLEGLDGSGKSTVGMRLAKKIQAERVTTPPKSMSSYRERFDGHFCLHAPFYYFGNYVAAREVSNILKEKPVVMDRYWHSTTAFALAQMKEDFLDVMKSTELPEKLNDVYEWPNDLLKPDVVIFLDVCEDVRNQRLSRRAVKTEQENLLTSKEDFRKSVLLAYDNMTNPNIQKVNGNRGFNSVLAEIDEKIRHLF